MKKLLLSALFIGFAFGCSNSDNRDEVAINDVILPKTMTLPDGDTSFTNTLHYNGAKLTEITYSDGGKLVYQYDGDNIIKSTDLNEKGELETSQEFTYKNGKLATCKTTEVSGTTKLVTNSTYEWITSDHLKETNNHLSDGDTTYAEYFYSNGNLVRLINSYNNGSTIVNNETRYTYDTKNNPLKNVKGFSVMLDSDFASNNLLKEEEKQADGTWKTRMTYKHEYNKNDYPTKSSHVYVQDDGTTSKERVSLYTYNK